MAAYREAPPNPQWRGGRQPNATEDQALAYLAEEVRSRGHRPAKHTIADALSVAVRTLEAWPRFMAAYRAAPPNPQWRGGRHPNATEDQALAYLAEESDQGDTGPPGHIADALSIAVGP